MTNSVAVADGIFTIEDGQPKLLGSRCTNCGNHMFPRQSGCPKCMFDQQEDVELATTGTLWTWTVQAFPPKSPPYLGPTGDDFVPYGVGYIELPGQLRVEARLIEVEDSALVVKDADWIGQGVEEACKAHPLGVGVAQRATVAHEGRTHQIVAEHQRAHPHQR